MSTHPGAKTGTPELLCRDFRDGTKAFQLGVVQQEEKARYENEALYRGGATSTWWGYFCQEKSTQPSSSHRRQCWATCPEHFPIDCKTFTVLKVRIFSPFVCLLFPLFSPSSFFYEPYSLILSIPASTLLFFFSFIFLSPSKCFVHW